MTNRDQALLAAVARGDRNALEQIYLTYKDDLLTLSVWLLGDDALAEDVLHDVFVALARKAGRLKLNGRLKNYLCVSCLNRCRDIMRQQKRQAMTNHDLSRSLSSVTDSAVAAVQEEQSRRLAAALGSLPAGQREVVGLRIYGQMKFREIAEATAVSVNTVHSRYRYALSALQAALVDEGARR